MADTWKCVDCRRTIVGRRTEHCAACHQDFRSTGAGDDHRVGRFDVSDGPDRRRCRSPREIEGRGWVRDEHGRWYRPMPADVLAARRGSA